MKNPWWIPLAKLGHSVGVGIGAGAGTAAMLSQFIPGYGPAIGVAIGVVASASTMVTHYADKGISEADKQK